MLCLGIETTSHTFGAAVVDENCRILSNEKHTFTSEKEGIAPQLAKEHHLQWKDTVLENALKKAGIALDKINLISVSNAPGLPPCLVVGLNFAKDLARKNKIPVIGVNHCIAHIEIGKKLTEAKDPIIVYASGANTQIVGFENGRYRVYGETLDVGIGNALDSFARAMGIGFPGGPIIDQMYFKGKNYIELPYTVKGMDLTFSGLVTAAEQKIGKADKNDLAYSFMHNAFAMLAEVTERALAHTEKKEVLLTGGVAASKALNEVMEKMCENRKAKKFVPPVSVSVDNAAMIAWLGIIMNKGGVKQDINKLDIKPRERTDQIEVTWF